MMNKTVLVIGGGAAGIRAALDVAKGGAHVLLVEKTATVGGKMAPLLSQDAADAGASKDSLAPALEELGNHPNIELLPLAEVVGISGKPGRFSASIRQRARFVTDACTHCKRCHQVCPVVLPNEYEAGMTFRKAIFTPFREAWPKSFVIDIDHCLNSPPNYLPCQRCVEVCESNCIRFDMPLQQTFTREVAAVIVAVGYDLKGLPLQKDYGYGKHPDILTAMELECLLSPSGPAGGMVERPSNGDEPESILMVLDEPSPFPWACVAAQACRLMEQEPQEITVVHFGERPQGDGYAEFWNHVKNGAIKLVRGEVIAVNPDGDEPIQVTYRETSTGEEVDRHYDMIVLSAEATPPAGIWALAEALGIQLGDDGFVRTTLSDTPGTTSRPGIYAAGCATGPKDISRSASEASKAAERALDHVRVKLGGKTSGPNGSGSATGNGSAPGNGAAAHANANGANGTASHEGKADAGSNEALRQQIQTALEMLIQMGSNPRR